MEKSSRSSTLPFDASTKHEIMKIIGLSEGGNSSAVFLENGKILMALEEERFIRSKGSMGVPVNAIDHGIKTLGWSKNEIEAICLSNHQLMTFTWEDFYRNYDTQFHQGTQSYIIESTKRLIKKILPAKLITTLQKKKATEIPEETLAALGFDSTQIFRYHHHLCHASAAYYGMRLNNDPHIVISLDGGGDGDCAHVYMGENGKLKLLAKTPYGHSPGNIYSCVTHFMGMKPHEHEYKLMGISAYAKTEYCRAIADMLHTYLEIDPANPMCFKRKIPEFTSRIGARLYRDFKRVRFDNMAGGLQTFAEEILLQWVKGIVEQTGVRKVVVGGGVFMNIKANKRIAEELNLEHFDVMPSCGDESNSFGAAWYHYAHHSKNNGSDIVFNTYCLGSDGSEDLDKAQQQYAQQLLFEKVENPAQKIAELLADGEVIARCSGPMEFGARALGNRSILADPTNAQAVPLINKMIKNRDFWMPFAPAMKKERVEEYVEIPSCLPDAISPFMMHAFETTEKRGDFYAGTHAYDKTARAQVVTPVSNAGFYEVICEFEKVTGRGVVLNTSFNLHGFPIVRTAIDACDVMVKSGLNHLMIDDYLVTKKDLSKKKEDKIEINRSKQ